MRYHHEKPKIYNNIYGKVYICNHPVYDRCTLYQIGNKGLAVIQQRYNRQQHNNTCIDGNIFGVTTCA